MRNISMASVQDRSNSSAPAMELLQSCARPFDTYIYIYIYIIIRENGIPLLKLMHGVHQMRLTPTYKMDPSHKPHNASSKYPIMHHFVKEMCTHMCKFLIQSGTLWEWLWCIVGFVRWIYWIHSNIIFICLGSVKGLNMRRYRGPCYIPPTADTLTLLVSFSKNMYKQKVSQQNFVGIFLHVNLKYILKPCCANCYTCIIFVWFCQGCKYQTPYVSLISFFWTNASVSWEEWLY